MNELAQIAAKERNLLDGLPLLHAIRTKEEVDAVRAAAAADGHGVLMPTHWVEREGEIVGYFNLGGMPTVTMWLHSTKVKPRESLYLINAVENIMRGAGVRQGIVLVGEESPFYPLMEKMGFRKRGEMTVFEKVIG